MAKPRKLQARITIGHCADETTILKRPVAINTEETRGTIRWLLRDFQNSQPPQQTMAGMEVVQPTICDSHEEAGLPPSPPAPKPKKALLNSGRKNPQT